MRHLIVFSIVLFCGAHLANASDTDNSSIYLKALQKDPRFSNVSNVRTSIRKSWDISGNFPKAVANLYQKAAGETDRFGYIEDVSFSDDKFNYTCAGEIGVYGNSNNRDVAIYECKIVSHNDLMILWTDIQAPN